MSILNITPDSFYAGSRSDQANVLRAAEEHLKEGSDMLDMGAQSSRPGADFIEAEEEWKRLEPALAAVQKEFPGAIISVDTFHGLVAQRALELGASVINDISAGQLDPKILDVAADHRVPYILMHSPAAPQVMQQHAHYEDVVKAVFVALDHKLQELRQRGICDIVVDPGFGFGKTVDHNWTLLRHLEVFQALDAAILAGLSRKSMFHRLLNTGPEEVLPATVAAHVYALEHGASLLRVHDTSAAAQAIAVFERMQQEC